MAARRSAALPAAARRWLVFTTSVAGVRRLAATAAHRRRACTACIDLMPMPALGVFDGRERQHDVASIGGLRLKANAAQGPRLHRIAPTWLASHRAGARQSNDTQPPALLCPKTLSSGQRTTLSPVRYEKPRGSRRLSCASATCNSLRQQATGPQQRKGESSPNPRSCVRLTQVFCGLQARKVLKASLSCA